MGRYLYNTGLSGTLPEGVGGLTSLQDMCVLGGASYGGEARRGGGGLLLERGRIRGSGVVMVLPLPLLLLPLLRPVCSWAGG